MLNISEYIALTHVKNKSVRQNEEEWDSEGINRLQAFILLEILEQLKAIRGILDGPVTKTFTTPANVYPIQPVSTPQYLSTEKIN